jgi:glycosyltransferase involved in cell wall biosynthesis
VVTSTRVSFVVIAYNEAANIKGCIESILGQDTEAVAEIIVVDDASTDETGRLVEEMAAIHRRIVFHRLDVNGGRGNARWIGGSMAKGDFLAYVDADIVLPPHWLSRCLDAIKSADAVGGVAVPDGDHAYIFRRFGLVPRVVPATTTVTGNNGLYRRELFARVGFDPDLREGEDVAFNHLLDTAGAQMLTLGDLLVRHEENKSFRESLSWLFESGTGASRQLHRYRRIRVPDLTYAGFLASLAIGARSVRRGRRRTSWTIPASYLGVAAAAHVSRAFELEHRRVLATAGAALTDACLLGAYFTGRSVGHLRQVTSDPD